MSPLCTSLITACFSFASSRHNYTFPLNLVTSTKLLHDCYYSSHFHISLPPWPWNKYYICFFATDHWIKIKTLNFGLHKTYHLILVIDVLVCLLNSIVLPSTPKTPDMSLSCIPNNAGPPPCMTKKSVLCLFVCLVVTLHILSDACFITES